MSTTVQSKTPLRRRKQVLERQQSHSSLNGITTPGIKIPEELGVKHKDTLGEVPPTSSPDDERQSAASGDEGDAESSEEEDSGKERGTSGNGIGDHQRPARLRVNTMDVHYKYSKERSPMSPASRSWYEFDLAVVVALVSPIGNWLTGGDHVKNLVLIVLLIFYLHQIIEVPWTLYQNSRPRSLPPHLSPGEQTSPEARYSQIAASELRKYELFFLFLTFLSPLLGATLLRYASAAILGPDAVSWFSTGLFVLATGVRPWAHLIERLSQRTASLQDAVHYPPPTHPISSATHDQLAQRVALLEHALAQVRTKVTHATEDVYEYVDDAVDAVEHAMRKQERKWDRCEGKVKEVEQAVGQLHAVTSKEHPGSLYASLWADVTAAKAGLVSLIEYLTTPAPHKTLCRGHGFKAPMKSLSGTSTPLETIVEEDYTVDTYPMLARPSSMASTLVYRAGYLATLPLRAVARMVLRNY